jgi:hypothetical protein
VTGRKLRGKELDRLLRETLRDSPARAGEGERLRLALREAWARARAGGAPVARPAFFFAPSMLRVALGIAASLVLALGLAFHLAFPPRLVADGLAAQASSLRALAQLRRVVAMDCVVDTAGDAGRLRRYRVEWRAPDVACVRLEDPDGTTWVRAVPPRQAGLLAGAPLGSTEDDPRLWPVRDVLSPNRIEGLLDGRHGVRVTFDGTSGLPVRLEAGWTATCDFRLAEPVALPLSSVAGRGR